VTQAGTAPNLTYTIVFTGTGLTLNPATMTVTNNTFAPGTVTPATVTDFTFTSLVSNLTKNANGFVASRLVLGAANTYTGVTTVKRRVLQITNAAGLGLANATEGQGTIVNQGAALELNAVSLNGEHLQLVTNNFQGGLYDAPSFTAVHRRASTACSARANCGRSAAAARSPGTSTSAARTGPPGYVAIGVDAGSKSDRGRRHLRGRAAATRASRTIW